MGNEQSVSIQEIEEIKARQQQLELENKKMKKMLKKKSQVSQPATPIEPSVPTKPASMNPQQAKPPILATPYDILGVTEDTPFEEIREAYKRLALQYHPDKNTIDTNREFRAIVRAYKTIKSEWEEMQRITQQVQETHLDRNEIREHDTAQYQKVNQHFKPASGTNFDNNRFNAMYEEHRFRDDEETQDGYADWMKETAFNSEDIPKKIQRFTSDGFNNQFEQEVKQYSTKKDVILYEDPNGRQYGAGYESLGGRKKQESYTNDSHVANSGLKYTDYRQAFTEENILHPGEIRNKETYQSLEQLKSRRAAPIEQFDEGQKQYYQTKQQREKQEEEDRLNKLRERDQKISRYYESIHGTAIENTPAFQRPNRFNK